MLLLIDMTLSKCQFGMLFWQNLNDKGTKNTDQEMKTVGGPKLTYESCGVYQYVSVAF